MAERKKAFFFFPWEVIFVVQQRGEKVLQFSVRRRALLCQDMPATPFLLCEMPLHTTCGPVATENQESFFLFVCLIFFVNCVASLC